MNPGLHPGYFLLKLRQIVVQGFNFLGWRHKPPPTPTTAATRLHPPATAAAVMAPAAEGAAAVMASPAAMTVMVMVAVAMTVTVTWTVTHLTHVAFLLSWLLQYLRRLSGCVFSGGSYADAEY